jgi:hypothetical protein
MSQLKPKRDLYAENEGYLAYLIAFKTLKINYSEVSKSNCIAKIKVT